MPYICPICNKKWRKNQASIQCASCKLWVHHNNKNKCSLLSDNEFSTLSNSAEKEWSCFNCDKNNLPFADLEDQHLLLHFNFGIDNLNCDDIHLIPNNETIKFVNDCEKINLTVDIDNDNNFSNFVNSKYYNIKDFNNIKPDHTSSFSLTHVNLASLNKNIDDLHLILSLLKIKFDIIALSEHKIADIPSKNIDIPGYNKFIFEPTQSTHGGTGFYVNKNMNFIERKDLNINSINNCEACFIEIKFQNKKNLIIGCLYRHPTSPVSVKDFNNGYLVPIIQKLNLENKQIMLVGDFNIDLLKINSNNDSNDFYNTLTSCLLTPFILQPTRLASKTLIDNIFFNSLEYQSYSGNLLIEISDHLMQFLVLEGFIKEKSVPKLNLYKRDFSSFNENEFNETILDLDWDDLIKLHNNDPNFSFNKFHNTITYYLDEFAPYKKITKKDYKLKFKPWISNEILNLIHERDKLFKLYVNEVDPVLKVLAHSNYKKNRNQATQLKRESKSSYFTKFFEDNFNKTSEIWKGIRTLVNIKSNNNSIINLLDENNNIINDQKIIANKFNNYFTSIGPNIEKKIPNVNGNYSDYLNNINTIGKSFYLSPTTSEEIDKLIDSLDINKSSGPNSIPVFILKIMKPFFSKWLSILINLSYRVSIFHDILKVAKVTPIHKKDCKLGHMNYRPISLLSVNFLVKFTKKHFMSECILF